MISAEETITKTCINIIKWLIDSEKTVDDNVFVTALTHEVLKRQHITTEFVVGENIQLYTIEEETSDDDPDVYNSGAVMHRRSSGDVYRVDHKVVVGAYLWLVYKKNGKDFIIDLTFNYKVLIAKPIILSTRIDIDDIFNIRRDQDESSVSTEYIRCNIRKLAALPVGYNKFVYKRMPQQKNILKLRFKNIMNNKRRVELIRSIVSRQISVEKYPIFKGIM